MGQPALKGATGMGAGEANDLQGRGDAASRPAGAPDSPYSIEKAMRYLSRTLLDQLAGHPDRELPWIVRIEGTMVMADVSGFTALSERLAAGGREGAEQLTDIINSFFGDLLEIAERHGGDTLTFGGDAVLLLFSGEDHAPRAVAASLEILASLEGLAGCRAGRHRIELGMSMGAHSAKFLFVASGSENRAHLLSTGPDAQRVAVAESAAHTGDLVITGATKELLGSDAVVEREAPDLWRVCSLVDDGLTSTPAPGYNREARFDPGSVMPYLPPLLADAVRSGVTPPALGGEHRKVTVAFAHVSGVNELLAEPGASEALRELHAYLAGTFELLERSGGTLVSSDIDVDGFKLVFAFGAPVAREHDADSAARFALEMQGFVSESGLSLEHRLGLHRANVYAGDVGSATRRQYTVMGDGVNLAARLMAHASPGTIVVSHELASMLDERFRCDDLDTIQVKGRDEPVGICRLMGETQGRDAVGTGTGGLPLVGRDRELRLINGAIGRQGRDGVRAVLVTGEPGIGKSRLMAEGVDRACEVGWRVLQSTCYEHMTTTPFGVWLPLLEQLFEFDTQSDADLRGQTMLARVDSLAPELIEHAPLLGPVLGVALPDSPVTRALDPTSKRRLLLRLVVTLLERAAALEPMAVAIEDVHWADESSLDLLNAMASTMLKARPVLLLLSTRPAGAERLCLPPELTIRIELAALPQSAATQLVEGATGMPNIPQALAKLLYQKSSGNPLFLEEVVRSLGRSGVLEELAKASNVAAAETISHLDFPDRVQTLLMARIDGLDTPAREIVRHAAVIGQVFDMDALTALDPLAGTKVTSIPTEIGRLERLGLVTSLPGDGAKYRFRHALVQEVAYGSLRFDRRRRLHHQLAAYLEARLGAAEDTRLDEVTHHYRRSGDRPKTFHYAVRSAVRARNIYATREAIDYYRLAFDSEASRSADAAGVRSVLLEQVGDGFQLMGCHRDAIRAYQDALQRWKRIQDRAPAMASLSELLPDIARGQERHPTLCHKIAICYERESRRYDRADHWVAQALACLPAKHSSLPAHVYSTQGIIRMRRGKYHAAIRSCERAAARARDTNDDPELAWALHTLSACYAALGYLETAITLQHRCVLLLQEIGDLRRLAAAYGNLANHHMRMGEVEQALSYNQDALAIETRIGSTDGAAMTTANIGEIEVMLGHFEEAIGHLEVALETSSSTGSDGMSGFTLLNLSRAYAGTGNLPRARATVDESVDLLARAGIPGTLAEALIQQAEITRLEGHPEDALTLCAHALRNLSRIGERMTRIGGLRVKGEALADMGRRAEALRVLDESVSLAREVGASLELAHSVAAREALEARIATAAG
jgi:class 3 adenylate cyclase/tetratricopeptide (TPR) repeat protein